jgi:hypothetical protein
MTQLETPRQEPAVETHRTRSALRIASKLFRFLVLALIAAASFLLLKEGRELWREYSLLRGDLAAADHSAVVGYPGISPQVTFAERPSVWYRQEGQSMLLWGGWVSGEGHRWYKAALGDVDPAKLLVPHPIVVAMAIDYPMIETEGGTIWRKMPESVPVVGQQLASRPCVYPLPVLMKVEVINDVVDERPYLVTGNILSGPDSACSIFDATLDGHRVTMASSGYFDGGQPILYDRGTKSLWTERADDLTAIAGKHKGKKLARVARPIPVAWRSWRSSNPRSRLVIGADRTQGIPDE